MVVSQQYVKPADPNSPHPSASEIADFMRSQGFQPTPKSYFGWERSEDGIKVLDARPDNFIKTPAGVVPVDLVMAQEGSGGESFTEPRSNAAAADNVEANSRKLSSTRPIKAR